jgi:hypothetical protein
MAFRIFHWTEEIIEHIGEHGVTPEEFEEVVCEPEWLVRSRSSGDPAAIGWTSTGRRLFCVFREIDELSVEPVTAYEFDE